MVATIAVRQNQQHRFGWRTLPYAALIIIILVLAAALYLIVDELQHDSRRNQTTNRDNLTWNATQIERELSALIRMIDSYYLNEPESTRDDLV
jgi:hypothetical protein